MKKKRKRKKRKKTWIVRRAEIQESPLVVGCKRDIVTSILKSGRNEASPRFSIVHFPFPLTLAGSPYNKCTFTIRVYYRRIRWPIFRPLFCCFIRTRCPLHTGEGEGHGFCFDLSYISLPSKFHQVGAQFARLNSSSEISKSEGGR